MGGGALPSPATTAGIHHSPSLFSPNIISPFSSNLSTGISDFTDETHRTAIKHPNQINFGHVPSQVEVQNAISDLRRVMSGAYVTNSEINGGREMIERNRFVEAYNLLQTDPLVQRLVLSISSDTEVWDAITKNEAVQDLQGSLLRPPTTEEKSSSNKQEHNSTSLVVKWIFDVMKSKIIEFIEKLELFVFNKLDSESKKTRSTSKHDGALEEKVRSSLLLSIVILVIVFVTRSV